MLNASVGRDGDRMVTVGADNQVSMQVLQDIYNDITGKTEKLSRSYNTSYAITFEDIAQLNSKIRQMYEQYHIVSSNCTVTVYHLNDSKERFSSFERFQIYDRSNSNPVENVAIEYTFLIILPKTDRPQPYQIDINLVSRVGTIKSSMQSGALPSEFFHFISLNTANIEIEYIDYTVARNFQAALDQWVASLNASEMSWIWSKLRSVASFIPFVFKNVTACCVAFTFLLAGPPWFATFGAEVSTLFPIGLLAFVSVYVSSNVAFQLGALVDRAIKSYVVLSYVRLNRGDELAIKEFQKNASRRYLKIGFGVVSAIGVNLFSGWLATKLGV